MPKSRLKSRARVAAVGTLRLIAGGGLAAGIVVVGLQTGNVPHGARTVESSAMAPRWHQVEASNAVSDSAAEIRMSAIRAQQLRASLARADRSRRIRAEQLRPKWALPLTSGVSSPYGPRWGSFHPGVDFYAGVGTPVHSAGDGYVISPPDGTGGYGNVVTIAHPDGAVTWYCHLSQPYVHPGQHVKAGDVIGLSGATGYVTGPHLHFEVRFNNQTVDPVPWLRHHGLSI